MKRLQTNAAVAALLAITCGLSTGCQSTGNWIAKRISSPEKKTQFAGHSQTPQLPPPEEITTEKQANIQLTMARAHERQGNFERALALYEEAVKTAPKSAEAHHRLAVLHDKYGQVDQSHEHYIKALKLEPNNAEIHCDYGYSCYLQGRVDEAEQRFRHALSIDPRLARAHNNLGLILARKGDTQNALVAFHRAGCNEGEARVNLAMAHLAEGRLDAANDQLAIATNLPRLSSDTRKKMASMRSLVARVDQREAAPLPPSSVTTLGTAPLGSGDAAATIPAERGGDGVEFVSAGGLPQNR